MASLNSVTLIGNLGRDPELKMLPSGQPVANFSVATTNTWKDGQGNRQSKTHWHNCKLFGKQAEVAEKYLRKGHMVCVQGEIEYRDYTDQQGNKKNITEIKVSSFTMLEKRRDDEGYANQAEAAAQGEQGIPF